MKKCSRCQTKKPLAEFHNSKSRGDGKQRYCIDCHKAAKRTSRLKHSYGISDDVYIKMVAVQGGQCAVCGRTPPVLHIDHHHGSGRIRGLLCQPCNTALGLLQDDAIIAEAAARYLKEN